MMYCPECGSLIEPWDVDCKECGVELDEYRQDTWQGLPISTPVDQIFSQQGDTLFLTETED